MSKTSKAKPCPHPDCDQLIDKRSEFCKKHRIITPKIRNAIRMGKEKIGWARVNRMCQNPDCNKQFSTPKGEVTKGGGKYCSQECRYPHMRGENSPGWKGGLIKVKCFVCEKEIEVKPFKASRKRHFCGYSCNSINNMKNQGKKETDIEIIFREALDQHSIIYEFQKAFGRICLADFFLPEYNIVIFCDGIYWHSSPERKAVDKRQVKKLTKKGYKVYRFNDQQIKGNIENCLLQIKELQITPIQPQLI